MYIKEGFWVKPNSFILGIIGTLTIAATAINVKSLQTNLDYASLEDDYTILELASVPKKQDLLGTYTVKNDKHVQLTLNNSGTYSLSINVCDSYLFISGIYELRNSKLILKNTNEEYEDLIKNEELSFTIIDSNNIVSDESLVCTTQKTLFEK